MPRTHHLDKGAVVYKWDRDALFSCGDCHATQGDGKVCGAGIEMEALVTLRFDLRKGENLPEVQYTMSGGMTGSWNTLGWHCTTGHGPDLWENTQDAVRYMISWLKANKGLTDHEAMVLCSTAMDLKTSEVVDAPNWIVSACLPLGIFRDA